MPAKDVIITLEMLDAGFKALPGVERTVIAQIYRAMVKQQAKPKRRRRTRIKRQPRTPILRFTRHIYAE